MTEFVRILACGSHRSCDDARIDAAMSAAHTYYRNIIVIEGDAPFTDRAVGTWALLHGVPLIKMPAAWAFYGTRAGPLRNQWMLDFAKPDVVLVFPGNTGTRHMKRIAQERGIPTYDV